MIKLFKRYKVYKFKERILKSFPIDLKNDIKVVLKIIPLYDFTIVNFYGNKYNTDNLISPDNISVKINNEFITIPARYYFNEPKSELENNLTDRQKIILNCILLKHHNGHIREKRLRLLRDKTEYWIIPYTTHLLGEYVYEILETLNKQLNKKNIENYKRFQEENPFYWKQTESRVISYWNEYHRLKSPKLKDYVGFKILDRIKKRTPNNS